MNEHILQKLMNKSYVDIDKYNNRFSPEKFAELIVREMVDECAKVCVQHAGWTPDMIANQVKQHFGVEE